MPDELHSLRYGIWDDRFKSEKPYVVISDLPDLPEDKRSNISFMSAPEEVIRDIRGREKDFNLDDNGFVFLNHQFPDFDVFDGDLIEKLYQPEVEKLLRSKIDGVDRVIFFDYRVRINVPRSPDERINVGDLSIALPPAMGVHVDQSAAGALKRVRSWTGDDTEYLIRGRTRILNIWRPYDYEIEDCPLALCDGSTIRESDQQLIADHVVRQYLGETVYPLYNPDAKWYYLNRQTKDETLILKIFDSDETAKAKSTPHTAFEHRELKPGARPRKSLEIRALVFTYPKS